MQNEIPAKTIETFANTIYREAKNYGFGQIDFIRLVNSLLDLPNTVDGVAKHDATRHTQSDLRTGAVDSFPLGSARLTIRAANPSTDADILEQWMNDEYGRHFLLTAATAQFSNVAHLLADEDAIIGIICENQKPIGAVAYLSIDSVQRRAELRKLIGEKSARGKGFAEEATHLWINYGAAQLGLQKIFVSTLQTHIRNIQLNENIGFKVEGLLRREVMIDGDRQDILRMGLCIDEYLAANPGN